MEKQCIYCGKVKDVNFFPKDNSRGDAHHPYCKKCKNKFNKQWRLNNKEKITNYQKEYYNKNREKILKKYHRKKENV